MFRTVNRVQNGDDAVHHDDVVFLEAAIIVLVVGATAWCV